LSAVGRPGDFAVASGGWPVLSNVMAGRTELDALLEELAERWELELSDPLGDGDTGPWGATRAGEPVVLSLRDASHGFAEEVLSLIHWDGDGAVMLIDHDPLGVLLMERALPGTPLLEETDDDAAMLLAAGVLERLWIPDPGGIETVADEVERWAGTLARRNRAQSSPVETDLIDEATRLLRELGPTQGEPVLLHGDLHLGNVLAAQRQPWLAIDPKPLIGEREFDVTALISDKQEDLVADEIAGRDSVQRRFDLLGERLGCERERLKGWSVAIMVDYALWCFEEGEDDVGTRQVATARILQTLRS
jgi:streptomycin 6-kinase